MVSWRILHLRQQIIPLLKESTMGMLYSQLTEGERNQIYALLQEDVSQCRIAMILGRDSSTIGRELRRNRGQRGYRPKQAQRKAQERRNTPRSFKMTPEVVALYRGEASRGVFARTDQLYNVGKRLSQGSATRGFTNISGRKKNMVATCTGNCVLPG